MTRTLIATFLALGLAGPALAQEDVVSLARSAIEDAEAAEKAGDAEVALEAVDRALSLLGDLPVDSDTDPILSTAGFIAQALGDPGRAREAWGRLVLYRERTFPENDQRLRNVRTTSRWCCASWATTRVRASNSSSSSPRRKASCPRITKASSRGASSSSRCS